MEPNIYLMEKWMEEEEARLRQACRRHSSEGRHRGSTKRPALAPVLSWIGVKQQAKAGRGVEKGQ